MPMKKEALSFVVLLMVGLTTLMTVLWIHEKRQNDSVQPTTMICEEQAEIAEYKLPKIKTMNQIIDLPDPELAGTVSVEEALHSRRSRREFANEPIQLQELSQVLWAAQGVTDDSGYRAAPSAKGAYPFTLYLVIRNVEGLDQGLYQYLPENHQLGSLGIANAGDLLNSAGVQDGAQKAPAVIVMSAAYAKMQEKFPENDPTKNTLLEAGHIGQNVYLQIEGLEMSTVVMGGFNPKSVSDALQLDEAEDVVYLIPFGHRLTD